MLILSKPQKTNKIKKRIIGICLTVAAISLACTPIVLAYVYSAPYVVTESNGTSYNMFPASVDVNNTWLANNGYMNATALDTRVETLGGTASPHLVASDRTLAALPIIGDSQHNLYYTTGNSNLPDMPLIAGYDGYVRVPDDASLEPTNDFSLVVDGYVDVSQTNSDIVSKNNAVDLFVGESGQIVGRVINSSAFTAQVTQAAGASDADVYGANWFGQTFTTTIWFSVVRFRIIIGGSVGVPAGDFTVSIRATSGGAPTGADLASITVNANTFGVGTPTFSLAASYRLPPGVYALIVRHPTGDVASHHRWRYSNANPYAGGQYYASNDSGATWAATAANDFTFYIDSYDETRVEEPGVTSGEHTIELSADTLSLYLVIDSALVDQSAACVTAQDNSNDWYLMQSRAAPYTNSIKLGIGVTFTPDPNPEATSVDGYAWQQYGAGLGTDWTTIQGAAGSNANDTGATAEAVYIASDNVANRWRYLNRSILVFDTSALPDTATIVASAVSLMGTAKADALAITPRVAIYASAPASDTAIVAGDYDSLGSTVFSTIMPYASWSAAGWNSFILNSAGRGAISLTGRTKLGTRDVDYDVANVEPAWGNTLITDMQFSTAEGANAPKLHVWYADATQGFWLQPITMVQSTTTSGTADAGSTNATLVDAALTQANDYWNDALLTIVTTTDTLAPQGETATVTDFDGAIDTLYFNALTAAVDAGDTYSLSFGVVPDRAGAGNNGRVAWGANPSGIAVTISSMTSSGQPSVADTTTTVPNDVLPNISVSDWFGDGTVGGAILTNPVRPFITLISDNTTLSEIQSWRWMGFLLLMFITIASAKLLQGHQGITAMIASAVIVGLIALDHNIFPLYLLLLAIGGFVAGLISERTPSIS